MGLLYNCETSNPRRFVASSTVIRHVVLISLSTRRSKQLEGREVLAASSGGQHTVILARDKKPE